MLNSSSPPPPLALRSHLDLVLSRTSFCFQSDQKVELTYTLSTGFLIWKSLTVYGQSALTMSLCEMALTVGQRCSNLYVVARQAGKKKLYHLGMLWGWSLTQTGNALLQASLQNIQAWFPKVMWRICIIILTTTSSSSPLLSWQYKRVDAKSKK